MRNNTLNQVQKAQLIAAGINPDDFLAGKPAKKSGKKAGAKKAKQPKALKAAKKHCYEARMNRLTLPNQGLTSVERREIAEDNREALNAALKVSKAKYDKKWAKLVAAYKAENYGI